MLRVKVPKDIREYEEQIKFLISLTYREWISVALILLIPLLNRRLILLRVDKSYREIIIWVLVFFLGATGFANINGMRLEKLIYYFIRYLIMPAKRLFKKEGDLLEI